MSDTEPTNSQIRAGRGGFYLLTWTCYGTWLPGDEREFVGRVPGERNSHPVHNAVGTPHDADIPGLVRSARDRMLGQPIKLTIAHARICEDSFGEVAARHELVIRAGSVMTSHVHLVVRSSEREGADLLQLFKGVSSRRLTQAFGRPDARSWWTRHGSRRLLPDSAALHGAIRYVMDQPSPLLLIPDPVRGLVSAPEPRSREF